MVLPKRSLTLVALGLGLVHTACIQSLDVGSDGGTGGTTSSSGQTATPACKPGEHRLCYDGPPGTASVGPCRNGSQTCAADGLSWGACEGQVLPDFEPCGADEVDANCDGSTACAAPTGWSMP